MSLDLKGAGFHLQKYKKSFLLKKHQEFFFLRVTKFHIPKHKEFFRGGFVYF